MKEEATGSSKAWLLQVLRRWCTDWEQGLSKEQFLEIVRDIWVKQLALERDQRLWRLIAEAPEDKKMASLAPF